MNEKDKDTKYFLFWNLNAYMTSDKNEAFMLFQLNTSKTKLIIHHGQVLAEKGHYNHINNIKEYAMKYFSE